MARPKQNFKIEIPEKWEDITLEKFIEIQSLYKDGNQPTYIQLISVLSNIPEKELNEYPAIVIEKIADKLLYLKDDISTEILNYIDIDGERYIINYMEDLKFGEFVDCNTVLDADRSNFPAILSIICRKEGEKYDDEYIAKNQETRMEMFKKQPITKVYPMIAFFLTCYQLSKNNTQSYLETLKDQANHTLNNYIDLVKNGDGKRHFMNSQMRKLKKLKKQLNNI